MYADIDFKWLDKNRNNLIKTSTDNIGDDGKMRGMMEKSNDEFDSYEFDDGGINLTWSNELGFFSLDYTLTDDEMMEIVEHMKAKGEKIRRLIKLAETE